MIKILKYGNQLLSIWQRIKMMCVAKTLEGLNKKGENGLCWNGRRGEKL